MRHPKPSSVIGPTLLALAFFVPGGYLITHAPSHAVATIGLAACLCGLCFALIAALRNTGR